MKKLLSGHDPPKACEGTGKRFYIIEPREDGAVDVYLLPLVCVFATDLGINWYDASVRIVRGVIPWPEIEEDVRARYDSWYESGEVIEL